MVTGRDFDRVGWVGVGTVGSGLRWSTTAATSAIHTTRGVEQGRTWVRLDMTED